MTYEEKIQSWWSTFPLDYWWRRKYKVPLFSTQHLESNQYDIVLEYLEERVLRSLSQDSTNQDMSKLDKDLFDKLKL